MWVCACVLLHEWKLTAIEILGNCDFVNPQSQGAKNIIQCVRWPHRISSILDDMDRENNNNNNYNNWFDEAQSKRAIYCVYINLVIPANVWMCMWCARFRHFMHTAHTHAHIHRARIINKFLNYSRRPNRRRRSSRRTNNKGKTEKKIAIYICIVHRAE